MKIYVVHLLWCAVISVGVEAHAQNVFPQTGNVGIGTTTLRARLQASGGGSIVSGVSVGTDVAGIDYPYEYETAGVSSTNFNLRLQSPNSLLFHTGGAERLTITSNGDVGIGTPTPERPLQIDHRRGMIITTDGVGLFHAGRSAGNAGSAVVRGANDSVNVALGHLTADLNLGFISVHDSAGQEKARMYVWTDGRGYVEADVKSFRVPNPGRPGTEIAYAAIEGPEAAAYARGTARLERGRAIVELPDHFASVAGAQRLTVQLTPGSAASLGLAVVAKSPERLVVQELMNGTGTYEFDWEVKSVRKGYEDYRVIQPALSAGGFLLDEGGEH